jgi:uncharacterized membrane protein
MSDPQISATPVHTASTAANGDRFLPALGYVLYLMGPTILIGFVMAYVLKGASIEPARSHYVFQIRTAWIALAAAMAGVISLLLFLPLTLIAIGFAGLHLSGLIFTVTGVWVAVRSVVGLLFVIQGKPYPRPQAWLI